MLMNIKRMALLLCSGLLAVSCSQAAMVEAGASVDDEAAASTPTPAELSMDEPDRAESDRADPDRFGHFPFEASDRWLLGTDYVGTSFVDLETGETLDAAATAVQFGGRSSISMSSSGCAIGSGSFRFTDGRVTRPELAMLLDSCTPLDEETHRAATDLVQSDPEIRVDGNRLLLLSEEYRLEMEASGPGVEPLIEDHERFVAIDTTVPGVAPARVEVTALGYNFVQIDLPTCDLYGLMSTEGAQRTIDVSPSLGSGECEYSPESDKAAQAFFTGQTTATRSGDTIDIVGPLGTIQFRLATEDDPPLAQETATRPLPIVPAMPDRSTPAEAGRVSTPWYAKRAGSTASGQADVPVPEDWEVSDPSVPSVNVTGRGYLKVTKQNGPQSPNDFSDRLVVTDGPTPVTIKLYRHDGQQVVESGATTTAQQYRYGSDDPGVWNRQVVWIVEYGGETMIAEVGYPEFPDDSVFMGTGNPIDHALTGLDPVDLLHDIRFFE